MKPQNYRIHLYFHKFDGSIFRSHFMKFLDENDIPGIVSHEFSWFIFECRYFSHNVLGDYTSEYFYIEEVFDCTFLNLHLRLEWELVG